MISALAGSFVTWIPLISVVLISVGMLMWTRWKLNAVPDLPGRISGPREAITVARAKELSASLRSFVVLIDDSVVGTIRPGEIKHFPVRPGPHTVLTRIDWCTSRALQLKKHADENIVLRCGVHSNLAAFYRPQDYVYIRNDG
jgi:hypothetical protein